MPSAEVSDPEMGGERGSYILGLGGGGELDNAIGTCCGEELYTWFG